MLRVPTHAWTFGLRRSVLLLAAGLTAAPSLALGAPAVFKMRDGVLADTARGALYVAAPAGGVEAVALSTGASLWESAGAAVPLAVRGDLLLAQGEDRVPGPRLPLVLLDVTARGKAVRELGVDLPAGVAAHVNDQRGRSFRATAEPTADGFLVSWTFVELKNGHGTAPDPEDQTLVRTLQGTARVPVSGLATPSTDPPVPRRTLPPAPWRAGTVIADVVGARGEPLVLRRRDADTGAPLPDRRLLDQAVVAMPSADERSVVGIERVGQGGPDDPEYRWTVFSLETGEPVGQFRRDVSATPFFVWGDTVLFESPPHGQREGGQWIDAPLEIRATRVAGGNAIWERAVRDLEYRGTTPPTR